MSFINPVFILLGISVLYQFVHAKNIAIQVEKGVQLNGKGKVNVKTSNPLSFTLSKSCQGIFRICYMAKENTNQKTFENEDSKCPAGDCMITLDPHDIASYETVNAKYEGDNIIATFNENRDTICPLKYLNKNQSFTIVEVPDCPVVMNDASLPKPESNKPNDDKDEKESTSEAPEESKTMNWVLIFCAGVVSLFISVGGLALMGYCYNRCEQKKDAQKPKKSNKVPPAASPAVVATSPMVPPTSPATVPTVSPNTPKTPATSPAVTTPKRDEQSKPKVVPEPNPMPTPITESKPVKTPEPEPYDVTKAIETAPRSLQDNGLLKCGRSALKEVLQLYSSKPRRQSTIMELDFFLLIVSEAYVEVHGFLRKARQLLCQNGAIFERRQWRSFNAVTRQYIAKASTPGYVAWYAFASEYGNDIRLDDEIKAEAVFEKLSASALLVIFFRENIKDPIRRSAYAHMRRHFTKIYKRFPEMQLYTLPYPLYLLADLKKRNEKAFNESENDRTYSTPLERINQRFKDEATVEDDFTDETQVSFSDGKERHKTLSTEILGSQTSATTTVKIE